ncbi:MAG: aldehyde dehydrogenase family protein [Zoogloeaceae bacterium]|nr:aldehyde dehydrogenase family protein [Zoogloeaceae bacterium]
MHAFTADAPPVLPCWIHGRAFISLNQRFVEVRDRNGKVLRRTPRCGKDEIAEAQASARAALPVWAAKSARERHEFLARWGNALESHAAHFARLLREETRKSEAAAEKEVAASVAVLRTPAHPCPDSCLDAGRIVSRAWGRRRPLADAARLFAPILAAGSVIIANPCASAPSAAFALCELSARIGLPPGVVNLVFADRKTVDKGQES